MPLSLENIEKARKSGATDDQILSSVEQNDPEFGAKIGRAREMGATNEQLLKSIESRLNQTNVKPLYTTEQETDNQTIKVPNKDNTSQESAIKSYPDLIRPQEYTREQLKGMSLEQRREYVEDMKRYREYMSSKSNVKSFADSLTFGLAPKLVQGLKKTEEEAEFSGLLGELAGLVGPAGAIYKYLGKPVVNLISRAPKYIPGLNAIAHMTGAGVTGATYGGIHDTITDEQLPSAKQLSTHFTEWAAFDGVLRGLANGANYLSRLQKTRSINKINEVVKRVDLKENNPETLSKQIEVALDEVMPETKDIPSEVDVETSQNIENKSVKGDVDNNSVTVSAQPKRLEVQQSKESKALKPITEETGVGASEQVDISKNRTERIKDATNSAIQAVKNPRESITRAGEIINENIFNYLAPLEKIEAQIPVEDRPSTFIRRAEDANSTVNSIIENGIFSDLTNQIEYGGLKEAYGNEYVWRRKSKAAKPNEASIQDLSVYRTAKQSLKRQSEGKKTGIDTNIAKEEVARLGAKYEPVAQRVRQFQRGVVSKYGKDLLGPEGVNHFNKDYYSAMYRVMDTGADSMLQSNSLTPKKPWYKFKGSKKRIIDPAESDIYNTSMMVENAKKNEAILKYREGVEKGTLPGRIVESKRNKLSEATKAELEAKEVDLSNEELVENLYEQSRTNAFNPGKNRLRGWKDGKPFEIEVPDEIGTVFEGLEPYQQGVVSKGMMFFNRTFSNLLTFDPTKFFSIWTRDAGSAYVWSHSGVNPKVLMEAVSHVYYEHPVYKQFLQEGGDRFALRLSTRIQRAKKINELITPGTEGPVIPFNKVMDGLKKYGVLRDKLGVAVPYAEYLKGIEKYGNTPQGRIKAMYDAKRVTYDPKARGKSKVVREIAPAINYLNVALQDLAMNVKNLSRPEVWARGLSTITSFTLALKMANEGNEKYEALTAADKAAFFHLFYGDSHIRIPIPWLMGTIFKVIPETIYDTAKGQGKEASHGLFANFVENTTGSLNPILKTAVEVSTGKQPADFLGLETRSPEVIPKRLQHLPKELQYTPNTSLLSRKLAPAVGMSPVMMDRIINNLGPNTPKRILGLIDEVAYQSGLVEDKRPEKALGNYLVIGNFFTQGPESRTKYAEKFYEYMEAAKTAKAAEKNGISSPDFDKLNSVAWSRYNRSISRLFKQYRDMQEESTDKSTKKQQLASIQQEINNLYKEAVQSLESQ